MRALVTSLGDRNLQFQQIMSNTLNNFFCNFLNPMPTIEVGLVPILLKLIEEQLITMLEEALALLNELLNFSW